MTVLVRGKMALRRGEGEEEDGLERSWRQADRRGERVRLNQARYGHHQPSINRLT